MGLLVSTEGSVGFLLSLLPTDITEPTAALLLVWTTTTAAAFGLFWPNLDFALPPSDIERTGGFVAMLGFNRLDGLIVLLKFGLIKKTVVIWLSALEYKSMFACQLQGPTTNLYRNLHRLKTPRVFHPQCCCHPLLHHCRHYVSALFRFSLHVSDQLHWQQVIPYPPIPKNVLLVPIEAIWRYWSRWPMNLTVRRKQNSFWSMLFSQWMNTRNNENNHLFQITFFSIEFFI